MPTSAEQIRQLLQAKGLRPKKSWGQNFLHNRDVLSEIVDAAGLSPESVCLELGAGTGALTLELAKTGCRLLAVERDRELVPIVEQALSGYDNARVIAADAARLDYGQTLGSCTGAVVLGNLPYQISARILVSVADAVIASPGLIGRGVFMVQREVAERCAAAPGSRTYGLLSVLLQRAFTASVVCQVAPANFFPPPKVHSTVVRCDSRTPVYPAESDQRFVATARAAFSQKRKTIRNALRGALKGRLDQPPLDHAIDRALDRANIEPRMRAETLALESFVALAEGLAPLIDPGLTHHQRQS